MNRTFKTGPRLFFIVALFVAMGSLAQAETARKLVALGNEAFQQGDFERALTLYEEASVEIPEAAQVYFNRGAVLYKQEDYEQASEAFRDAAQRSKEPILSSQAKFNQGNCAFRLAERQRDSDLKKAIEHCQESISFYQDAHDLDPDYKEAAENIEIVRLYVKVLLDEQKKKQEEQQKQDQQDESLATKLKKLIERQQKLLGENGELAEQKPDGSNPAVAQQWNEALGKLTDEQKTLGDDTGSVLEEIQQTKSQAEQQAAVAAQGQGQTPDPANPAPQPTPEQIEQMKEAAQKLGEAAGHVTNAIANEEAAASQLGVAAQKSAARNQETAVQNLEEAVKALGDENQEQQQQQGDQSQDQQEDQDDQEQDQSGEKEQGEQEQNQEQKEGEEKQDQPQEGDQKESEEEQQARARMEKADDILDEEKRNQKERRPVRPGRVLPVDRDW